MQKRKRIDIGGKANSWYNSKKVNDTVEELLKGLISESSFNEKMKNVDEQLKALNEDGKVGLAVKELGEFKEEIKELSKQLEVLKAKGFNVNSNSNNLGKRLMSSWIQRSLKTSWTGKQRVQAVLTLI